MDDRKSNQHGFRALAGGYRAEWLDGCALDASLHAVTTPSVRQALAGCSHSLRLPSMASLRRDSRFLRHMLADNRRTIPPAPIKPDPSRWMDNRLTAAWLGHSTVLLNFYGVHILTDPVLASRCGVRVGPWIAGPKRLVAPALTVRELPHIDIILLSHAHMDHFDRLTLARLGRRQRARLPHVVTARSTLDLLRGTRLRRRAVELDWGQRVELDIGGGRGRTEVQAFEVHHWGARLRTDDHRGYNGYAIHRAGAAILFAGDTAYAPTAFGHLRGRGGERDEGGYELALMPIGAYDPWIANHCTPEQAVAMADAAGARFILPIHHQTFQLSREPVLEPISRLVRALPDAEERIALRQIGETFQAPE